MNEEAKRRGLVVGARVVGTREVMRIVGYDEDGDPLVVDDEDGGRNNGAWASTALIADLDAATDRARRALARLDELEARAAAESWACGCDVDRVAA